MQKKKQKNKATEKKNYILIRKTEVQLPVENNFIGLFQFLTQFMRMHDDVMWSQCHQFHQYLQCFVFNITTKTIQKVYTFISLVCLK